MIFIEIKCGVEIIPALLQAINDSGLERDQSVVICFNKKVIQELKTRAPQYKAYWLSDFKKEASGMIKPSLETVLTTLARKNHTIVGKGLASVFCEVMAAESRVFPKTR